MAKNMNFEDAMKRLEEIVATMEGGSADLDKSLALFEEGVKLTRYCSSKLEEAKKKIEILVKKGDAITKEPFAIDQENTAKDEGDLFK